MVFLRGLTETEDPWRYRAARHHGRADVTVGSLLHRDLRPEGPRPTAPSRVAGG